MLHIVARMLHFISKRNILACEPIFGGLFIGIFTSLQDRPDIIGRGMSSLSKSPFLSSSCSTSPMRRPNTPNEQAHNPSGASSQPLGSKPV